MIIIRRPKASADLSEIWEFIAEENVERADAFVDRIDAKFRTLAQHPLMGVIAVSWRRGYVVFRCHRMSSSISRCRPVSSSFGCCMELEISKRSLRVNERNDGAMKDRSEELPV